LSFLFKEAVQAFAKQFSESRKESYKIDDLLKSSMSNLEVSLNSILGQKVDTDFLIRCSVGAGNWANVAWLCALDPSVTKTTQSGHYFCILFRNDLRVIYIGLGVGVTKYQALGRDGSRLLDEHITKLRNLIRGANIVDESNLIWDGNFDLGASGRLPDGYKRATLFTKQFEIEELPEDESLENYFASVVASSREIHTEFDNLQKELKLDEVHREEREDDEVAAMETFLWDESLEEELLNVWGRKKNLILQGPPGVGKTFWSERIAERANEAEAAASFLIGEDPPGGEVFRCQFHQSMSYEDFVQGYRPTGDGGFELKDGIFLKAAKHAHENPHEFTVLIIDEINRGNISKIFGELLSTIEADKRDSKWAVTLPYSGEKLWIPERFYILGMMNTADRSISVVDYALRRRFGFINVNPTFDKPQFKILLRSKGISEELLSHIYSSIGELNRVITESPQHGAGFQIGHSYFIPGTFLSGREDEMSWYKSVIKYEIDPLLREYWFDDIERVEELLRGLVFRG
jgi:MoxR-like ATPase